MKRNFSLAAMCSAAGMALLTATNATAHHPGGGGSAGSAGPINTISASTLAQGQGAVAIMFEMIRIREFSDTQLLHNATQGGHSHSLKSITAPAVAMSYGVTNDLMVSARLPYLVRRNIREGHQHDPIEPPELHDRGDTSGVGDVTVLGQYRFFNNRATGSEAAVLLGFKAPTGETKRSDRAGERFETEFQPGTGSWDGLLGGAVTQRFGAWSFDANVLYVLAGKGEKATDMGDRLLYNAAVSYRLIGTVAAPGPMYAGTHSHTHKHGSGAASHHHQEAAPKGPALDLVLELNGDQHAKQIVDGEKDPNSGGNVLYLSPGARLSLGQVSSFVSVGIPVVNNMNGTQAAPDWRLMSGIAVSF